MPNSISETTRKRLRAVLDARATTANTVSMNPPSPTQQLVEEILQAITNGSPKRNPLQSSGESKGRARRRAPKRTGQTSTNARRKASNAAIPVVTSINERFSKIAPPVQIQELADAVQNEPLINLDQILSLPISDSLCLPEAELAYSMVQQPALTTMITNVNPITCPITTTVVPSMQQQTVVPNALTFSNDLTPNVYRIETMTYLSDLFDSYIAPTLASTPSPLCRTRYYKQLVLDITRQTLFTHSLAVAPEQAFTVFVDVVTKLGLLAPQ